MAKLSQHPLAEEAEAEHPHQLELLHQLLIKHPQAQLGWPSSVHHHIITPTSISSTFNCADNANFTCLLSHRVFNSPKRSALFALILQKRKPRLIEVKRLPKVTQPAIGTVGIQTQEGSAPESPVRLPQLVLHSWFSSSLIPQDFPPLVFLSRYCTSLHFIVTTLKRCNSHVIQPTYFKCTIQWFLLYSELCNRPHNFRNFSSLQKNSALTGVAQRIEHWPVNQMVTGSIPHQGTCLGCRAGSPTGGV